MKIFSRWSGDRLVGSRRKSPMGIWWTKLHKMRFSFTEYSDFDQQKVFFKLCILLRVPKKYVVDLFKFLLTHVLILEKNTEKKSTKKIGSKIFWNRISARQRDIPRKRGDFTCLNINEETFHENYRAFNIFFAIFLDTTYGKIYRNMQ